MGENKVVKLSDLVGLHVLSGCAGGLLRADLDAERYEDAETFTFVLDGVTYQAIQDPSDGYRSSMRDIRIIEAEVGNRFEGVRVFGHMSEEGHGSAHNVLNLRDVSTGKIVLSVGTANTDDYYPYFVAEFTPENMAPNSRRG